MVVENAKKHLMDARTCHRPPLMLASVLCGAFGAHDSVANGGDVGGTSRAGGNTEFLYPAITKGVTPLGRSK